VGELKELHAVYDTYHGKGLEVLSVSMDVSPQVVRHFRATRWRMPWPNTVVPVADLASVSQTFDVVTPKNIIVDPNGTIVWVCDGAGANLEAKVAELLQGRL